jgi:hypothetical protein
MNIFVTSLDPKECALNLDDKRLVKMVLETAQILSTVCSLNGKKVTYKPTHANHPCIKWTKETDSNYEWLFAHFIALCAEYTHRFNKIHKCSTLLNELRGPVISKLGLTPFVNCTSNKEKSISFKNVENIHEAYTLYLNARWKTDILIPKWTNQKPPLWAKVKK